MAHEVIQLPVGEDRAKILSRRSQGLRAEEAERQTQLTRKILCGKFADVLYTTPPIDAVPDTSIARLHEVAFVSSRSISDGSLQTARVWNLGKHWEGLDDPTEAVNSVEFTRYEIDGYTVTSSLAARLEEEAGEFVAKFLYRKGETVTARAQGTTELTDRAYIGESGAYFNMLTRIIKQCEMPTHSTNNASMWGRFIHDLEK
jgi:hypothetical protein